MGFWEFELDRGLVADLGFGNFGNFGNFFNFGDFVGFGNLGDLGWRRVSGETWGLRTLEIW